MLLRAVEGGVTISSSFWDCFVGESTLLAKTYLSLL